MYSPTLSLTDPPAQSPVVDGVAWVVKRRERTHTLIELGGLVVKAGLVELTDDDRATLYGAFLWMAGKLRSDECDQMLTLWRRRGKRAFESQEHRPR